MAQKQEDALVSAALFALVNLDFRSETRQKWSMNDQKSYEKLKAALIPYIGDESKVMQTVMQVRHGQQIQRSIATT